MPDTPDAVDDAKRKILERVADGSLSPSEAADRLAELNSTGVVPPIEASAEPQPPVASVGVSDVRTIKVRSTFRSVQIVGDPAVREAVAEGRHNAHHDGDTLVIDGGSLDFEDDEDDEDDWFRFRMRSGPNWIGRSMNRRFRSGTTLQVRMNPDLALDVKVEAGPVKITDVHGPVKARVSAGPLKIDGFEAPIDLQVAAGPVKARGRLDYGESTIQCDAGSVHLQLSDDSSVRVKAAATLGKVHLFDHHDRGRDRDRDWHWEDIGGPGVNRIIGDVLGKLGGSHEATIGAGEGTLDVEVTAGAVHIAATD